MFTSKLNEHAPKKKRWVRGNNKPHVNNKPYIKSLSKDQDLKIRQIRVKTLLIFEIIKNNGTML